MRDFSKFKRELDSISYSICLAKWLQVTVDLRNGETQSCHHPTKHKIPLEEVEKDYHALHNTLFKRKQRKKMLNSERPRECKYCWNIEDSNQENISDRIVKSSDGWAWPYLKEVTSSSWDDMIAPTYLEVMFSNLCNLTCSYCNAATSSSIKEEIERYGRFPLKKHEFRQDYVSPLEKEEQQIYIKAFWKWLPEIYDKLHFLRVTGGEPILDENTFKLLDFVHQNPNKKLTLAFNSNFSLPHSRTKKFFDHVKEVENNVSQIEMYISLDAIGDKAQYIRSGLNFDLLNENLRRLRHISVTSKIIIMCTYSVLSMDGFSEFLNYILNLKKRFGRIHLDVAYLQTPDFLSFKLASPILLEDLQQSLAFARQNFDETGDKGFNEFEIKKIERLYHFSKVPIKEADYTNRLINFYKFIEEYDRRKGLHFEQTFPAITRLKNAGEKLYRNLNKAQMG